MTEAAGSPAVDGGVFFDNFNPNKAATERLEEVYHKLCELLTELAEAASEVDADSAQQAYTDGLDSILKEHGLSQQEVCALADSHPLKEAFFAAFDGDMFAALHARFVAQVQSRKDGNEWDAEAAQGECDEDHTLE